MDKVYSVNEEEYRFNEISEAAEYVFDDTTIEVGEVRSVWEGDLVKRKASDYLTSFMIDDLSERAYDECGEFADDWPDATKEQESELLAELKKAVDLWADKYNHHPNFGNVENTKEIKIKLINSDGEWDYA